jgi:hypothetical protein
MTDNAFQKNRQLADQGAKAKIPEFHSAIAAVTRM